MKITIEVIPHDQQRYPTVGDWQFVCHEGEPGWKPGDEPELIIKVSKMSDWRYAMLVAVHELLEVLLCKQRGITQEQVDAFDMAFEKSRTVNVLPSGNVKFVMGPSEDAEPGDDPSAPYHKEHFFATNIEALLCAELGVEWNDYEKEVQSLP